VNEGRSCERCVHARRIGGEQVCTLSAAFYDCAEERSMPWLTAVLFNACGRSGRFFVPAGETPRRPVAFDY
jgi:hypothetical protein